jgi:hypothetical protein
MSQEDYHNRAGQEGFGPPAPPPVPPTEPIEYNLPAPVQYQSPPGYIVPAPQQQYVPAVAVVNQPNNDMANTALILGLLVWVTFGLTGIPAVICGHVSLSRIKHGRSNAVGFTWVGLVCGYIAVIGWSLFTVLWIVAVIQTAGRQ